MVAELAIVTPPRGHRRLLGKAKPRISPPMPLRSDIKALRAEAEGLGITLMPWQLIVARYIEARTAKGTHLYPEICVEVARQNGKTTIAKPVITKALKAGLRVLHIADKRELPREMHSMIASALSKQPELFPKRRGKTVWPRYGAGQEEIELANGGRYRIAAKTGGRGWDEVDVLIIDELREMEDFAVIAAASSTQAVSQDPLTLYFTNAGDDNSVVLSSVRERAGRDPNLALLEWSAEPDRSPDDRTGWTQANPALGHQPALQSWLEREYTKHLLAGTMPIFETENLCRSVPTLMPRVVSELSFQKARGPMADPVNPQMAVKVDPEGRRASAVIAWSRDGYVYVRSFAEDIMAPLDVDAFARELVPLAKTRKVRVAAYDPWTDRDLVRALTAGGIECRAVNGADYMIAGERFVRAVESGQLRHDDDGTIATDLGYTVRRETANGWFATRSDPNRPTTAGEAAIRAVWLATAPQPPRPRIF